MNNYTQALNILNKAKIKISDELINSSESLNRVNSKNIYSNVNLPATNNSSFDGFAIKASDTSSLSRKNIKLFKILDNVAAGDKPVLKKIKKFHTIGINTGAILPKDMDAIVPIEQVVFLPNKLNPKFIKIDKKIKKFQNVRLKGQDFKKNDLIISKGEIIESKHIMALKALGIIKIKVKKIPNILYFSSGNEVSNLKKLPNWKVKNSNRDYIKAIQKDFLFNFKDGGILKDKDEFVFEKKIKKMINSKTDLIITSGAVSAGKFDFIPRVVKKFRLSHFLKNVAIRPGKPVLFAKIKNKKKAIFGLPGNPISAAACFRFFVYPYLRNSLGVKNEKPIKAILKKTFVKKSKFTHFTKSKIHTTKNGKLETEVLKGQESFKIHSLINSNIWTVFPSGKSKFKKNHIVDCFFPNHPNKIF